MTDSHSRARRILVTALMDDASTPDVVWLEAHLSGCPACSALRDDLRAGVAALRLPEVTVHRALIEATGRRLQARANSLRHERGLYAPLLAASVIGLLSSVLTAFGMARALVSLGAAPGLPPSLLAAAGVALWFLPVSLAGAAALLAGWRAHPAIRETQS